MRYLWLCLLIIGFLPTHAQEPAPSDAPYLYYYSDIVDGFVIERADGTDSRVLGAGLVPDETEKFEGAGWSPSGEWFAFTSIVMWPYASLNTAAIHVSGTRELTSLETIPDIISIEWHPHQDILLVTSGKLYEETTQTYSWIHAQTDTVLQQISIQFEQGYEIEFPVGQWVLDGANYVIFYLEKFVYPKSTYSYLAFDKQGKLLFEKQLDYYIRDLSSQGWLIYGNETDLIFENVFTNVNFSLHFTDDTLSSGGYNIEFSPNGYYALLSMDSKNYWLNFAKQTAEPMRQYDLALARQVYPRVPAFSPDSRYFVTIDRAQNLVLVATETFVPFPLGIVVNDYLCGSPWQWKNTQQLIIYDEFEPCGYSDAYVFDIANHHFEQINFPVQWNRYLSFSSDGNHIFYVMDGAVIKNLATGEIIELKPHSGAKLSNFGGEIIPYSADYEWFLTADEALVAGGATWSRWISVASKDGLINRELGKCTSYNSVCADWLPEQVDTSQLPQREPTTHLPNPLPPHTIISVGDWTNYIRWSENNEFLAIGDAIYNSTTGELVTNVEPVLSSYDGYESEHLRINSDTRSGVMIEVIDKTTNEVLFEIPRSYPYAISPDETLLAIAKVYDERFIEIWSIPEEHRIAVIPSSAISLAFSPDGKYLAAGVSWEVWIWETADFYQAE